MKEIRTAEDAAEFNDRVVAMEISHPSYNYHGEVFHLSDPTIAFGTVQTVKRAGKDQTSVDLFVANNKEAGPIIIKENDLASTRTTLKMRQATAAEIDALSAATKTETARLYWHSVGYMPTTQALVKLARGKEALQNAPATGVTGEGTAGVEASRTHG